MSRLFLLILTMVIPSMVSQAQKASLNMAKKHVAQFFTVQKSQKGECLQDLETRIVLAAKTNTCYVFNVDDGDGWAVTTANGSDARVLAFSSDGHLDADRLPGQLKALLAIYDGITGREGVEPTPTNSTRQEAIAPMLTSKWGEHAPYNSLCPLVVAEDGENMVHAVAGSAAVAVAQLMRYYKWPTVLKDIEHTSWHLADSPFPDYGKLPDFTPDWDVMADMYDSDDEDKSVEVARLMQYIGYGLRSYYKWQSTSVIWTDICNFLGKAGYDTRIEGINPFIDIDRPVSDDAIYEEVSAGRPVIILMHLIDEVQNHVAVVDGYTCIPEIGCGYYHVNGYTPSDNTYHVNWGWNGEGNGYYYLPTDITSNEEMSSYFYTMQMIAVDKPKDDRAKDANPTNIDDAQSISSTSASDWYDLQGRRLTAQPRRGLYIRDGRKYVAR